MQGWGEAYKYWVLAVLIGLSAVTAYLWPYGFSAFTPIAGIVMIPLFRVRRPDVVFGVLLLLCLYALGTTAWSPVFSSSGPIEGYADAETQTWGKLPMQLGLYAVLTLLAASLPAERLRRLKAPFVVGAMVVAVVLLVEGISGAALYRTLTEAIGDPTRPDLAIRNVAQGTYALALMFWPALRILLDRERKRAALLLTAGVLIPPFLLSAMAPLAAVAVSGLVWGAVRRGEVRLTALIGGALATVILLAPWIVLAAEPLFQMIEPHIGASWAARLEIWRFSAEQVLEHPLFGWGVDGSRAFLPFMLHPHSAPLQLWLELGAIGAALAAGFWMLLIRRAGRLGAHAVAAAVSYFVIGGLSFGVWQEWWLGLGVMTVIWSMVAAQPEPEDASVIEA
ncbi:O-antigen ligase family protein [Brevundimonas sp.]|uniref:O-antigen ligase family protein n=1 Tax=Brevundimonas sp. TaxID=1871086 RepID=UPI0025FA4C8A|nr:O-antigen ligase family protein [Brevundimonas sp.]